MELEIKELSDNARLSRSLHIHIYLTALIVRPGEGCVLLAVPVHGVRRAELGVPGLPHLHRLHAGQAGAGLGAAGAPRHVHHHHHAGDGPV